MNGQTWYAMFAEARRRLAEEAARRADPKSSMADAMLTMMETATSLAASGVRPQKIELRCGGC